MKPDDVPPGVWDSAEEPALECFDAAVDLYETGIESGNIQLIIARAIMAERESCLCAVDAAVVNLPLTPGVADGASVAIRSIKEAIRNRP